MPNYARKYLKVATTAWNPQTELGNSNKDLGTTEHMSELFNASETGTKDTVAAVFNRIFRNKLREMKLDDFSGEGWFLSHKTSAIMFPIAENNNKWNGTGIFRMDGDDIRVEVEQFRIDNSLKNPWSPPDFVVTDIVGAICLDCIYSGIPLQREDWEILPKRDHLIPYDSLRERNAEYRSVTCHTDMEIDDFMSIIYCSQRTQRLIVYIYYNTDEKTLTKHTEPGPKGCVDDGPIVAQRFAKILTTLKLVNEADVHLVDGGDNVNTPAIAAHWKIIDLPNGLKPPASLRTQGQLQNE